MNVLRTLEETKYQTPEISVQERERFTPSVLMRAFMLEKYNNGRKEPMIFTDLYGGGKLEYLVIYILDVTLAGGGAMLVCAPGHRLNEEDEELLISYCTSEYSTTNVELLTEAVRLYNKWFPHTNLILYEEKPAMTILHMYFCLFRGIHELLFKARYPYLAAEIEKIEDVNLLPVLAKGAPVNLFEKGFTNRLLRMLNTGWGINCLRNADERKNTLEIYKAFAGELGGYQEITQSQWLYLKACRNQKLQYCRKMLKMFGSCRTARLYEDYIIFQAKKNLINQKMLWERKFDSEEDAARAMEEADVYIEYLYEQSKWDRFMEEQDFKLFRLDYSDEHFVVKHPVNVRDIFEESENQHNCLKKMYKEIATGKTAVGFLRRAECPEKSFVTFEVKGDVVIQILGRDNKWLSKESEEMKWFVSVYMARKGLKFSRGLWALYNVRRMEWR